MLYNEPVKRQAVNYIQHPSAAPNGDEGSLDLHPSSAADEHGHGKIFMVQYGRKLSKVLDGVVGRLVTPLASRFDGPLSSLPPSLWADTARSLPVCKGREVLLSGNLLPRSGSSSCLPPEVPAQGSRHGRYPAVAAAHA